ncbi:MAG: hypothetical protein ACSHYB_07545 [Roseibacillus sp.]
MKLFLAFLFLTANLFGAELFDEPVNSEESKILRALLVAEVAKQASREVEEVKVEGSLKLEGKWGFFVGKSLGKDSKSLALEPYRSDDTCALFLETKKGWVIVDWSAGYRDMVYYDWARTYGVSAKLLGLPDYLAPE